MPLRRRGVQARRDPRRRYSGPVSDCRGPSQSGFERLVGSALDTLPAGVQRLLEDVAIVIDDLPTPEQLRENELDDDETLYGLYEGTPATLYGSDWVPLPNKITLFRLPLEEDFPDPDDLAEQVRVTVLHELAHHAGIDDDRLETLGLH